jgi:hypothetical protein
MVSSNTISSESKFDTKGMKGMSHEHKTEGSVVRRLLSNARDLYKPEWGQLLFGNCHIKTAQLCRNKRYQDTLVHVRVAGLMLP